MTDARHDWTPEDVARVAKGLSGPQRDAVLTGMIYEGRGFWKVNDALNGKGLLPLNGPRASAVRAHLLAQEAGE